MNYQNPLFREALACYTKLAFLSLKEGLPPGTLLSAMSACWHRWVPIEGLNGLTYESVESPMYPHHVLQNFWPSWAPSLGQFLRFLRENIRRVDHAACPSGTAV